MILYQMAKRLEQRKQLQQTIQEHTGDVKSLLYQKEQVDEQLMSQANVWTEAGQDEFTLAALQPENEWMQAHQELQ